MCKNCPFIADQYQAISKYADKYNLSEEDIISECYCDKVGGKILHCGRCEDSVSEKGSQDRPSRKTHDKHERVLKEKERLKKIADETENFYPQAAFGADKNREYCFNKEDIVYYKRAYKSNGRHTIYGILKTSANQAVRRYKDPIPAKGGYKKIFDLWWNYL